MKREGVGRNDPCPCGSRRKFKKCCLRPGTAATSPIQRMLDQMAQASLDENTRRMLFGEVRPIISAEFKGRRFVAVGDELHANAGWRTFADFLWYYGEHLLGGEWIATARKFPEDSRHQILGWLDALGQVIENAESRGDGVKVGRVDGPSRAYLLLTYDLYVLKHHEKLQEKIVARLKNRDQFQGARYELLVAATMIRAGFELKFEDEADGSKKHPEFIAVHKETGVEVAVEAKSRHRDGVLGRPGEPPNKENFEVGIRRLLNGASRKADQMPLVIFIDANIPAEIAEHPASSQWHGEVDRTIARAEKVSEGTGSPFNLVLVTNFPDHYGAPGSPPPAYLCKPFRSKFPKNPMPFPSMLDAIQRAVHQFGNVPQDLQSGV
jgi:hypothetical protein